MTPRCRADARASPRSSSWYSRRATITAGTATSTGAALVYRSVAPVCARKTTMPPMAAAQAVTSTTTLGSQRQRRRACPAPRQPVLPGRHRPRARRGDGQRRDARPPGGRAGRGRAGDQQHGERPGQRGGGHAGDRRAARPEPEQLPQGRPAGPEQGQLRRPAGRDHPGREQQRHDARHRQARRRRATAGRSRRSRPGRRRPAAGAGRTTRSARSPSAPGARSAWASGSPIWFTSRTGPGPGRAARSCRSEGPTGCAGPHLPKIRWTVPSLAGVRDDRAVPALAVADLVEGGRGEQGIGVPERRTGIGGLDDPGDVEVDHGQLPASIASVGPPIGSREPGRSPNRLAVCGVTTTWRW